MTQVKENMKQIRLIALDLDGTTLDSTGQLPLKNRKALERAAEEGIYVVVASGRAVSTLPAQVLEIKGLSYAITSNGAAICTMPQQTILRAYHLAQQDARAIIETADAFFEDCHGEKRLNYEVFVDGIAYAQEDYAKDASKFGGSKQETIYVRETRRPVPSIHRFMEEHIDGLDSIDLIIHDTEKKEAVWKLLEKKGLDIYITSSVPRLLEISSSDCGKWAGIRHLLDILDIKPQQVIAFGDARNDLDMVEGAGIGVAMANAHPALKKAADYITGSNDESGVARALYALGILK